jgi:hypothetical protein
LWKNFDKIILSLSYDGHGKQGEFIRKGMNWEKTLENHRTIQSLSSNIEFIITPTISVLNVFHIIEFLRIIISEKMISSGQQIGINILDQPSFYNIRILNQAERNILCNLYEDFIDHDLALSNLVKKEEVIVQLNRILSYVVAGAMPDSKERESFMIYNSRLNKIRSENMLALFPELKGFYREKVINSL